MFLYFCNGNSQRMKFYRRLCKIKNIFLNIRNTGPLSINCSLFTICLFTICPFSICLFTICLFTTRADQIRISEDTIHRLLLIMLLNCSHLRPKKDRNKTNTGVGYVSKYQSITGRPVPEKEPRLPRLLNIVRKYPHNSD